jgi:hypothetical protein
MEGDPKQNEKDQIAESLTFLPLEIVNTVTLFYDEWPYKSCFLCERLSFPIYLPPCSNCRKRSFSSCDICLQRVHNELERFQLFDRAHLLRKDRENQRFIGAESYNPSTGNKVQCYGCSIMAQEVESLHSQMAAGEKLQQFLGHFISDSKFINNAFLRQGPPIKERLDKLHALIVSSQRPNFLATAFYWCQWCYRLVPLQQTRRSCFFCNRFGCGPCMEKCCDRVEEGEEPNAKKGRSE